MIKNNIGQLLAKRAKISTQNEAFVEFERNRRFTFSELNSRCNKISHTLLEFGISPGDRVATFLKNGIEFIESYFAIAKIGAVLVPINNRLCSRELDYILSDSGATLLIYDSEFDDITDNVMQNMQSHQNTDSLNVLRVNNGQTPAPEYSHDYQYYLKQPECLEPETGAGDDDLLFIMYTSGTTGKPKGVMHSHNNMLWAHFTSLTTSDLRSDDRYLLPLPMFHVGCLVPVSQLIHRGATGIIVRDINIKTLFKSIAFERASVTMLIPSLLQHMLVYPQREAFDLSSIRWIVTGAAPVPTTLIQQYERLGIAIYQAYGLTESCGPGTLLCPQDAISKIGSCGKPLIHTEAKLIDCNGKTISPGEDQVGELLLSGQHIMLGYWNNTQATEQVIKEGWLYTGDLCSIDSHGFIFVRDRKKDMIISGGENIYPAELENILADCPEVKEVAVIGVASTKWGETPMAIVVPANNATPTSESLKRYCQNHLAGFKVPQIYKIVDSLPRNASGKLLKPVLREQFSTAPN